MKKILIILVMVLALTLSGCSKEKLDGVKCVADRSTCDTNEEYIEEEFNQIIIIVKYRVDYYTFEEGFYYKYKFTVEDTTNIFEHNVRKWFTSKEKWEVYDVVIVTEDNDELYFLNIGNLNYVESD